MSVEVSIVTGTYNRIKHLRSMVQSTRDSIGFGIPYEIIVVDGGSTDGTIQWCRRQDDIALIEHGELLGAVKAFNDGARAARGRYVILANDDILFLGESILSGISFMQDNPDVGVGCFYQDRYNRDWHIDVMPAIDRGRQVSVHYGQVCIVPRWLGNEVGWWGDYLHTYGGDNELSCNVLEKGYLVSPVPCTRIHDSTPRDELRVINNSQLKGRNHPDTQAWLDKWTRPDGMVGPKVKRIMSGLRNLDRYLRVFYAPIYEPGHEVQKRTKKGLREALQEVSLVVEYDYMSKDLEQMVDTACAHDPDLFVFQVHDPHRITRKMMSRLRGRHPHAIFFNWNGDYHPNTLYSPEYMALLREFDLTGLVTTEVKEVYNDVGISWMYWQIGFEDPDIPVTSEDLRKVSHHDVVFLANGYSGERLKFGDFLRSSPWDVGIYGSWPRKYSPNGSNLYDFRSGEIIYRAAKMAIGDSQWPHAAGFVSNRLFQAMATGVLLLQQRFDGMEELLGLKDEEHLVVWDTYEELSDKIEYYLSHTQERVAIARTGEEFVRRNHSFEARVRELLDVLGL